MTLDIFQLIPPAEGGGDIENQIYIADRIPSLYNFCSLYTYILIRQTDSVPNVIQRQKSEEKLCRETVAREANE